MAELSESPRYFLQSDDGQAQSEITNFPGFSLYSSKELYDGIMNCKWIEGDVLMSVLEKCGTHLVWELTQMLLRGNSEFIDEPKEMTFIDSRPADLIHDIPSPKVVNTHFRIDVLPKEFQNRKTIVVIRNIKDALVSGWHHFSGFRSSLREATDKEFWPALDYDTAFQVLLASRPGHIGYCDFYSYYWKRRDSPDILFLHYEDVVRDPRPQIARINEFLGTNRSEELMDEIAAASAFDKMKSAKETSEAIWPEALMNKDIVSKLKSSSSQLPSLWRKGKIGDWKNHLTVSQSERLDHMMEEWIKEQDLQGLSICYE